jgi:hypothetical protein
MLLSVPAIHRQLLPENGAAAGIFSQRPHHHSLLELRPVIRQRPPFIPG